MTVTISQQTTSDKTAQLVQKAAQITALAAITNPNNSQVQALAQARTELVVDCLTAGRLDPGTLISTMSVNVNLDPSIGAQITGLTNQTNGDLSARDVLLRSARIHAIQNALNKGQINAVSVLATMS